MAERHVMDLRWTGSLAMAEAFLAHAREAGHDGTVSGEGAEATLHLSVEGADLQTLRDEVDALLVVLSALEDADGA